MKKAMSLMLVLLLCFAMAIPASAATPALSTEGKIEHLIDCGLPTDVLRQHRAEQRRAIWPKK